jgi:CRP-like cAMP-binding protein
MNAKDLQSLKNLASFSIPQLEKLAGNLQIKNFDRNDVIFNQDEKANSIYVLLSGVIRVSYISNHERQTIVSILPAGEFFGLESLIPEAYYPFR